MDRRPERSGVVIVERVRKPADQCLPIEVTISNVEHYTDLEVRNHALAAVGETIDRFTESRVQRYLLTTDATVTLHRT